MAADTEANTYRADLLEVGVAVANFDDKTYSLLKARVSRSGENPAVAVHGVAVKDVLMCGAFLVDKKAFILVLPRDRSVLEAVIDFLRFEAMRKPAPQLLSLASEIQAYGIDHEILDKQELRSGTTRIGRRDVDPKTGIATESIQDGHKAEVIGAWAVHKEIEGGKGFRVTHRTLGRAINSGSLSKKAATQLAKALGTSQYPWGLLTDVQQANGKDWKPAKEFAVAEIAKTNGAKKAANPSIF